ncbi:class I SAM-dependent methyltransferase [Curtobacterium sp. MCBD17_013]|uniref:class I SAM-dependent DNA methyltransferase n=1 Tax=unclassified Curtobacterium TaxID=257496 RepID=UPI000DA74BE9|nr:MULTISPECIES: class I SAM-dependent methyltransferase [unclassified Curtobacterium]PZE70882.1 class I SAM-dependent methyltransferase [Curtobacterium sp. MCBD17_019]PZF66316.1 class I SAM-dependent methyltransferase [Curtobacterium sp. MCBD17_013]
MSDPLLEQTRSGYDAAADTYAEHLPDTSFEAPIDMAMVDHFAHMLPRAATVLDAGCGTGRMLRHLQDRDGTMRLTGVDISSGMLAHAARRGIAVDLRQSDLAALPFDDATFAGVLAWYSIIHTAPDGLRDVVTEVRRVLRPDGVFLLGFQAGTGTRRIERPYGQEAPLTAFLHEPSSVTGLLRSLGFRVDAVLDRAPRQVERHRQGFVLARTAG